MKRNESNLDRIIRTVLGVGFVVLAFVVSLWFLIPAAILLVTAATGFCGIYALFGISTYKANPKDTDKK